jgi:hypothetical protein
MGVRVCNLFDKTYRFSGRIELMIQKAAVLMLHGKLDEAHDLIADFYRQEKWNHENFYQIKIDDCEFWSLMDRELVVSKNILFIADFSTSRGNLFLRESGGFNRSERKKFFVYLRRVRDNFWHDPDRNPADDLYNELWQARKNNDTPGVAIPEKALLTIVRKYQQGRCVKGRGKPVNQKRLLAS